MNKRILVAEDSPTQAEYLRYLLESAGYQVEVVNNGRQALDRLGSERPDLILSDVLMPEMDGYALCEAVKSNPETRQIPFIILTQLDTPTGIAVALQHGAEDFIPKPFEERSLLERIRQILESGSREPAAGSDAADLLHRASLLLDDREHALRSANDFLESLIAASPGVSLQGDALSNRIRYVSPNASEVLGYSPEEILAMPGLLGECLLPEDRERVRTSMEQVVAQRQAAWQTECVVRRRDGEERYCYLSLRFDYDGSDGTVPMVAHLLDITPRKRAEEQLRALNETLEQRVAERTRAVEERAQELAQSQEALRRTNAMLQAFIEASPLAIIAANREGNVTLWNPAAEQSFGWREEEVVGGPVPIVPQDSRAEFQRLCARTFKGEAVRSVEVRRQRRDGSLVDVSLWTAALRDGDGNIQGGVAILEDITERKQLEAQYLQAQKMEAVGRLAGGVAHDFNNMLSVIMGYSDLLQARELPWDRTCEHLQEIQKASERAADLTRQLLAFSRQQVLRPRVIDLSETVQDVSKMLRRLIGENIELTIHEGPGLGRVRTDPGQMEQILMNLAVNARDAMPEGGRLTLETSNVEVSPETLPHADIEPGSYVLLTVRDTGCGIDRELQARIFDPFFTTKEPGKGTGLGLATVYGIVQQSGGQILVESEPGKGTKFEIYLPRVEQRAALTEPGAQSRPLRGHETILLVEDEAIVRELVREVLQNSGYTVLEATNGGEALHFCQRYKGTIHLVLTDVVMPGMNGRELADRLTRMRPETRVLFMSGYPRDEAFRRGELPAGMGYVQKPFTGSALSQQVREVLDTPEGVH